MASRRQVAQVESRATRKEMDRVISELRAVQAAKKSLREKFEEAFDQMDEIVSAESSISDRLKALVRQISEPNKTLMVVDDPDLLISVQGRMSPKEYSLEKAEECWPEEVIDLCLVAKIDAKKVEELLDRGLLTDKVAEAAMLERTPATPAVTIKVK